MHELTAEQIATLTALAESLAESHPELAARLAPDLVAALNRDDAETLRADLASLAASDPPEGVSVAEYVPIVAAVADAVEVVAGLVTAADAAAEQAETALAEARGRITATEPPAEPPADETTDDGETETPPAETPPADAPAGEQVPLPVAASAPARVPLSRLPARTAQTQVSEAPGAVLVAGADVPGFGRGQPLNATELAAAMTERIASLGTSPHGRVLVATASTTYPEGTPRLVKGDPGHNTEVIREMQRARAGGDHESLTAAGNCAIPTPIRDQLVSGSDERRVPAAAANLPGDRGGVAWNPPPTLASVSGSYTHWTEGNKNVLVHTCPTTSSVTVAANAIRQQFDNFASRYSPEIVEANMRQAAIYAVRSAESALLAQMITGSTHHLKSAVTTGYGALPDFLTSLGYSIIQQRADLRIPESTPLVWLGPEFLLQSLLIDVAREAPGNDEIAATISDVTRWLENRNVRAYFYLDPSGTASSFPGVQAAGVAGTPVFVNDAPAKIQHFLYPDGAWGYVDGGRIDVGLTRDQALNQVNKYEQFTEFNEVMAMVGSTAYEILTDVTYTGSRAALSTAAQQ